MINDKPQDQEDRIKWFTYTLITIGNAKTSTGQLKRQNPWLDDACKSLIKAWKKAVRVFDKQPTCKNLTKIKICRAQAQRYINEAKNKAGGSLCPVCHLKYQERKYGM